MTMSGCKSCSSCSPETTYQAAGKAQKLEKPVLSNNPRYPRVFAGTEAIFSDETAQIIVTVVSDLCDECCDCFTLVPHRILKDPGNAYAVDEEFQVSKEVGENSWTLRALL
jgi:hypothetical protein